MHLETIYQQHLRHTGDPVAAAILTQTQALLGQQPPPSALTAKQAAEALGVTVWTVYDLCKQGKLKHRRIGRAVRLERADIDDYREDTQEGGTVVLRCLKRAG